MQFFKGGRTYQGAKSAVKYLLNERVKEGTAKVYEGNPELTLKLIKSINRKWKFTSGVISFEEPLDKIEKHLPKIKEQFEKTFFAGLEKDQYNILYVLHTDKGRAELHFIVPRIELTTGKDLSIYTHKKDLPKKDLFQRYINSYYNLTSPLSPERQETLKITDRKWSNENKEFKKQIHEIIEQGVVKGLFGNREEILSFLKENGIQVKREGKNYITIVNPENNKSVRLKGEYYDENWTITGTIEKISRKPERESIVKLGKELRERVERDGETNRKKYSKTKSRIIRTSETELKKHRLGTGILPNSEALEMGNRGRISNDNNINSSFENKLDTTNNNKHYQLDNRIRSNNDSVRAKVIGAVRTGTATKQSILNDFKKLIPATKQSNNTEYRKDERIKSNDRKSAETDRKIGEIKSTISDITSKFNQYIKSGINVVRRRIMGNREELERFKTDINIADVAVVMGFEIDKKKSSRKSIVLKGQDVIVVSRNSNGHYVYFNPQNNQDSGTIIDFIQKRTNYNLGQVRKVLRQFLGGSMQHLEISNQEDIKTYYKTLQQFESNWEQIKQNKKDVRYEIFKDNIRGIELDTLHQVPHLAYYQSKFYFPIFNKNGICGLYYTDTNMKEKYFSKGSIKGIWADKPLHKSIDKIIVTESPVDSLSAVELGYNDENTLHIATLGRMGQEGKETLSKIFKYLPNAKVLIATDRDEAGEEIAQEIANLAKDNEIYRLNFKGKDLNEALQIKREEEYKAKTQSIKTQSRGWGFSR